MIKNFQFQKGIRFSSKMEIFIGSMLAMTDATLFVSLMAREVTREFLIFFQYYDSFYLYDDGWWFKSRKIEIRQIGDVSQHLLIEI